MLELEYKIPFGISGMGLWQVEMAEQIKENRGIATEDIERSMQTNTFVVQIPQSKSDVDVSTMRSDIEQYLPKTAIHIETRES